MNTQKTRLFYILLFSYDIVIILLTFVEPLELYNNYCTSIIINLYIFYFIKVNYFLF